MDEDPISRGLRSNRQLRRRVACLPRNTLQPTFQFFQPSRIRNSRRGVQTRAWRSPSWQEFEAMPRLRSRPTFIVSSDLAGVLHETHGVVIPDDEQQAGHAGANPVGTMPSHSEGAQAGILYGIRPRAVFSVRFKPPKGCRVPPHTLSKARTHIVISRSFRIGMAKKAGPNKATRHAGGASSRLHRVPRTSVRGRVDGGSAQQS
jgi:hypothetical protein